jgi:hypothetical protein
MSSLVRNLLFALLAVGTIAAAGGQAPAPGADPEPAQKDASAAKPTPEPTPTPKPTPTADAEEQLEEFVPTEDLPADQAVAFPVDI